jgi:DNA polymerase III sliding clamp (beta) subunit (PCNA family)
MIKLNKANLQDFQRLTSSMPKNTVMPILGCVKLENATGFVKITKSNLGTTVVAGIKAEVDSDFAPILLDEKILFGFLAETKFDSIVITAEGNEVQISDTITRIKLTTEDASNFPQTPQANGDVVVISREIVDAFDTAKNFVNDSETAGNYQFVHCKDNFIAAFNSHFFYLNNKFEKLPEIMLNKEMCDVVCASQSSMKFQNSGNHYFFTSTGIQYIFTKIEGKIPAVASVLDRLKLPGKEFTIPKVDLVSFCNVANMISETAVSSCSMTPNGPFADLKINDTNYSRNGERNIPISGTFDEFTFNARIIINPLKNVPLDTFNAKTNSNCMIITGKDEYFCFIGMSK